MSSVHGIGGDPGEALRLAEEAVRRAEAAGATEAEALAVPRGDLVDEQGAQELAGDLDEIGRGLKSAAKNIEEEIPKIGPAIGKTFKQVTGGEKETDHSPKSSTSSNSTKPKK